MFVGEEMKNDNKIVLLFADTYINKQYACALTLLNQMVDFNIVPIFTFNSKLPRGIRCDALVYFNYPLNLPPLEYENKPRILIDHGASHLKWFLANRKRFCFFDKVITAGPDHVRSLVSFFPGLQSKSKTVAGGFIKSEELLNESRYSREEICSLAKLDPTKKIVLFAPTWYKFAELGLQAAINNISKVDNHVACLHPETDNVNLSGLNLVENIDGLTLELLKHADIVISEVSSTIYEANALGKQTIQLLLTEYSDNTALMYDMPLSAGSCELFCGGMLTRPEDISKSINALIYSPEKFVEFYKVIRHRVLSGTNISASATSNIIRELRKEHQLLRCNEQDVSSIADKGIADVTERLALSSNRLIAHAGGRIDSFKATNSKDSLLSNSKAMKLIEFDVVETSDGYVLAHDGLESEYYLDKGFNEISTNDFLKLRFKGHLEPMDVTSALKLLVDLNVHLVLDIKSVKVQYCNAAKYIFNKAQKIGVLDKLIIQSYCVDDFVFTEKLGYKHILLAVWKYFYKNVTGDESYRFIEQCYELAPDKIFGISIPYSNKYNTEPTIDNISLLRFYSFWKRIYIHGAPYGEYSRVLGKNYGLFCDAIDKDIEFSSIPNDFDWKTYLFLNPGLLKKGITDQISSTKHYLKYGQYENRLYRYAVPPDFDWAEYTSSKEMKRAGYGSPNTAKAHCTIHNTRE